MNFEIQTTLFQGLFYQVKIEGGKGFYYLLPTRNLDPTPELYVSDLEAAKDLKTNFTIGVVGKDEYVVNQEEGVGYMFHSVLPVNNYHTSLLSFSKAWQQSSLGSGYNPDSLNLLLKKESFYLYHSTGVVTFVTCPDLSDKVHSYLTMI